MSDSLLRSTTYFRISNLNSYVQVLKAELLTQLTYRVSFMVWFLGLFLQSFLLFYLWEAVYAERDTVEGLSFKDVATYVFVGRAIVIAIPFQADRVIAEGILSGEIATALTRPLDFQLYRFFQVLGGMGFQGVVAGLATAITGFFLIPIALPKGLLELVFFTCSVALALMVAFGLNFLAGVMAFWTSSLTGITWLKRVLIDIMSGALLPLYFYPDWLQNIFEWLPFQAIVHIPMNLYLSSFDVDVLIISLSLQFMWVLILWGIGRYLLSKATDDLTIFGG